MSDIKNHFKKHKNKYIIGGVVVAVGVVSIVVLKRRVTLPIEAVTDVVEPLSTYALGSPDSGFVLTLKPSLAEAYNQAAQFIREAPVVPFDGENLKWLVDAPVDLSVVEKIEGAAQNYIKEFGPLSEEIFSTVDPRPLFAVPYPSVV